MARDRNVDYCRSVIAETRKLAAELDERRARSQALLQQTYTLLAELRELRIPARRNGHKPSDDSNG
jgi:putative hemolysin